MNPKLSAVDGICAATPETGRGGTVERRMRTLHASRRPRWRPSSARAFLRTIWTAPMRSMGSLETSSVASTSTVASSLRERRRRGRDAERTVSECDIGARYWEYARVMGMRGGDDRVPRDVGGAPSPRPPALSAGGRGNAIGDFSRWVWGWRRRRGTHSAIVS